MLKTSLYTYLLLTLVIFIGSCSNAQHPLEPIVFSNPNGYLGAHATIEYRVTVDDFLSSGSIKVTYRDENNEIVTLENITDLNWSCSFEIDVDIYNRSQYLYIRAEAPYPIEMTVQILINDIERARFPSSGGFSQSEWANFRLDAIIGL